MYTFKWNKPDGATVTVECNRGFELNGPSQAKCSNGMWTPTLGICLLKTCTRLLPPVQPCSALAAPAGASLTYSNSSSAQTESCFVHQRNLDSRQSRNNVTPMATSLHCLLGKCSPKFVLNAIVNYSDNGLFKLQKDDGSMATLTCFRVWFPKDPHRRTVKTGLGRLNLLMLASFVVRNEVNYIRELLK
ncbi:hypothetical protein COOONC_18158 [Cooperia oncophora]